MELKQFVSQTIIQVVEGVQEAKQNYVQKESGLGPSRIHRMTEGFAFTDGGDRNQASIIEFDIAVMVSENDDEEGKIGIFVRDFGLGYKTNEDKNNTTVNRIKFSIPVVVIQ